MKYLVTGGAGFIGSNLCESLLNKGKKVVCLDNFSTGKENNIKKLLSNNNFTLIEGDIVNFNDCEKATKEIKFIFHTAALARVQPSIEDPIKFNEVNVNGTLNLLKAAVNNKVSRFIYSASSSAYGDTDKLPQKETDPTGPISPYAVQKLVGEIYCKMFSSIYDIETISLRYFNVFGERMNIDGAYCLVMGIFAKQKLDGKPMTINGDGNQRRDFTYVGDVVNANILAAQSEKVGSGEIINIGNGDNRSVNQIADIFKGERVNLEPVKEPFATLADNTKAKELLGWAPTIKVEDWIIEYKKELGF